MYTAEEIAQAGLWTVSGFWPEMGTPAGAHAYHAGSRWLAALAFIPPGHPLMWADSRVYREWFTGTERRNLALLTEWAPLFLPTGLRGLYPDCAPRAAWGFLWKARTTWGLNVGSSLDRQRFFARESLLSRTEAVVQAVRGMGEGTTPRSRAFFSRALRASLTQFREELETPRAPRG